MLLPDSTERTNSARVHIPPVSPGSRKSSSLFLGGNAHDMGSFRSYVADFTTAKTVVENTLVSVLGAHSRIIQSQAQRQHAKHKRNLAIECLVPGPQFVS